MTEAEWLACDDPGPLLELRWDGASERQVVLLAAICCRKLWHLLSDQRCQLAIDTAERYAEGTATVFEQWAAADEARAADVARAVGGFPTYELVSLPEDWEAARAVGVLDMAATIVAAHQPGDGSHEAWAVRQLAERKHQADLARDILGNPFRPAVLGPTYRTAVALSLAQAAYEHRALPSGLLDPARLAVLSDALEEAGCTEADILTHLRSPGPHVRGCWALDLVLGKS
jgi:hypothetical protein